MVPITGFRVNLSIGRDDIYLFYTFILEKDINIVLNSITIAIIK